MGCESRCVEPTQLIHDVIREDGPALRRFVQSRTRDASETDDIMQDIYLRVLQNVDLVERSTSRRAYLFRVAQNIICDRARQRTTNARVIGDFRIIVELDEQNAGRGASSPQEQTLRAREGRIAADRAMGKLKEKHRQIYCLSRMDGLRNGEIAKELGVSLRSVERHVSEISLYMRETLASYI